MTALAFATPGELGYDPNVTRLYVDDKAGKKEIVYRYHMKDGAVYETVDILSSFNSQQILGRGTRVWKVRRIEPADKSDNYYALKDVWLDETVKSERTIQQAMFDKMKDQEDYRKHFVDIVHEEIVNIDGQEDRTKELAMRGKTVEISGRKNLFSLRETRQCEPRTPSQRGSRDTPLAAWNYIKNVISSCQPMVHYRLVHKQVGTPLDEIKNYKTFFKALSYALKGMPPTIIPVCFC